MSYSVILDDKQLDPLALRNLFGQFLTGVTIITTIDADGQKRGFTANSFTSVSLEPALILVCLGKNAHSLSAFTQSAGFGVNILEEQQEDISHLFATKADNKFADINDKRIVTGAPIIKNSLAWLDCVPEQTIEAGDHIILIGRVKAFGTRTGRPLGYWRGSYVKFGLEEDAGLIDDKKHQLFVACVLELDGKILLQKSDANKNLWMVPHCMLQADIGGHRRQLEKFLQENQLAAIPEMLYSVFDVSSNDASYIVYRGHLQPEIKIDEKFELFAFDAIPWQQITDLEIRDMLQRYCSEAQVGRYGIYFDSDEEGNIVTVTPTDKDDSK